MLPLNRMKTGSFQQPLVTSRQLVGILAATFLIATVWSMAYLRPSDRALEKYAPQVPGPAITNGGKVYYYDPYFKGQ